MDEARHNSFPFIARERFEEFHREFHGDTWDVCARCGGKCEIHKIGSLMPGEAEYIADNLGMPIAEFRDHYLDGIVTPLGVVDVLKLKPGCPFLSADYRCTIPDVKVVLCDVYPIVFEVGENDVDFMLDPWCPITRHVQELAGIFERDAIPALRRLKAPLEWYRAVELYDGFCVDYDRIFALRESEPGYAILTLDAIATCQIADTDPPELAEVVAVPLYQLQPSNANTRGGEK
jgi:Fe-S-cluster containining protein